MAGFFNEFRVAQSLIFCVVFCKSLFVSCLLAIALHVLRITASHCPLNDSLLFSQSRTK